MRCRVVICTECCTRVDGVNHCHACLKALGQSEEQRGSGVPGGLAALGVLALAWGVFFGLAWFAAGTLAP
jgi:hypothetical protein